MRWADDTEEAFPPRHPREPGGLRKDILDEIADHLECAAEREAECGGENDTEDAAWRRVLERFGNPDAIARKLWWDEMRETVMREWIQTGVVVVVAIAVVVFMTLVMRQMNTANQAVLEALKSNATAVNPLVTLKVKVTRGTEDGPPAEGVEVRLTGAAFGGESVSISRSTDTTGVATFGPMQAGQFEAFATDPKSELRYDGSKVVTLFVGSEPELVKIVAPDVALREASFDFSTPLVLGEGRSFFARFYTTWEGGGVTWQGNFDVLLEGDTSSSSAKLAGEDSNGAETVTYASLLTREGKPLKIAGEITGLELSMSSRLDSGNQTEAKASLGSSSIAPIQDGTGYRLELPAEFVKQFGDWRVQDHAKARGVDLNHNLWHALRAAYPDYLVDVSQRVEESETGMLSGSSLYHVGELPDPGEFIEASGMRRYQMGTYPAVDFRNIGIVRAPERGTLPVAEGTRLLLGLFFSSDQIRDFDNALQALPVLNDVFSADWPVIAPEIPGQALEIDSGANVIAERSSEDIKSIAVTHRWILFDVTSAFSQETGDAVVQGLLLRWSREEFGFQNEIKFVAAGAKQIENKTLRPMWLVLKPMGAEEVAATQ